MFNDRCRFDHMAFYKKILVRIDPLRQQAALAAVQHLYHRYHPGLDFAYTYLDDSYNQLYASEQRVGVLTRYFAGMAILISCLGLFGLTAFTAQKRQKEIGIRKVIGASALQWWPCFPKILSGWSAWR